MAEEKIYPYAVARIRVLEKKLLSLQMLTQMAEAKTPEEALRVLTESGYGEQGMDAIHDFENLLTKEIAKTYEIVKGLVPEEGFVDVFLYKNDYHNLKVLIKEEISGADGSRYLIDGGTISIEELKNSLTERSFNNLPSIMSEAIAEAYSSYSKTQNGQMIDIIFDKAVYKNMKQKAIETKNQFVISYVAKLCDLTNLKSFLRVRNMKKGFDTFYSVFVEGGDISIETFSAAFGSENPALSFKATAYSEVCIDGMGHGFTVFEKLCDNYMMNYVKDAKFKALTLEPLIAFIYAKETEVKTVRIIMTSKLNHIDSDTIKERLRDAYV